MKYTFKFFPFVAMISQVFHSFYKPAAPEWVFGPPDRALAPGLSNA